MSYKNFGTQKSDYKVGWIKMHFLNKMHVQVIFSIISEIKSKDRNVGVDKKEINNKVLKF